MPIAAGRFSRAILEPMTHAGLTLNRCGGLLRASGDGGAGRERDRDQRRGHGVQHYRHQSAR